MNLFHIDKELKKLKAYEEYLGYKYEPRNQISKGNGKRHIYYEDLKFDFIDEISTFGFSPFILQTFDKQRKDENIMKFRKRKFNQGLLNYVKQRNKNNYNYLNSQQDKPLPKTAKVYSQWKADLKNKRGKKDSIKNDPNKTIFLQKALENLAKNKLNVSDDDEFFDNDKEAKVEQPDKIQKKTNKTKTGAANLKEIEEIKANYIKSLNYKVDLNPLISFSNFEQPDPLKLNFERFFNKRQNKSIKDKEEKKLVGLMKSKTLVKFTDDLNNKLKGKKKTDIVSEKSKQNENSKSDTDKRTSGTVSKQTSNIMNLKSGNVTQKQFKRTNEKRASILTKTFLKYETWENKMNIKTLKY